MMTPSKVKRFKNWLTTNGAELLQPTNPYELVRFIAQGGTHIVYTKKNGSITVSGFAKQCLTAWQSGKNLDMGFTKTKRKSSYSKYKAPLLSRDGNKCFYCGEEMDQDDMSVEHLISISHGGLNKLTNMALTHEDCNQKAGSKPLVEKLKLRDEMRAAMLLNE